MEGVKDAMIGQISILLAFSYLIYPYVPFKYQSLWMGLHLAAYAFRYNFHFLFQKLDLSEKTFKIASSLLHIYTFGLGITSILWGSAILFFEYLPQTYHFVLYMIAFGLTFASLMSIGPIVGMYLIYTLPMDLIIIVHLLKNANSVNIFVALFIIMAIVYSLRASKIYYSIYRSMINEQITTKKALQKAKTEKESLQHYLRAIEDLGLGIIVIDAKRDTIIEFNKPASEWFGNIQELSYEAFASQNIVEEVDHGTHKHITINNGKAFEMATKKIEAQEKILILFKDVTEEKKSNQVLQKMAQRYKERAEIDPLTQIFNRESFMQRLQRMSYEMDRTFTRMALLFIDLDDFKSINDTYGHKVGDQVLQVVAKRIKNTLRQSDLVGRYAGDEFVAVLQKVENRELAENITTKLLYSLSQPILIEDKNNKPLELYITVSIGISIYPDDTKDLTQLVNKADRAMYSIKSKNKNGYEFYDARSS